MLNPQLDARFERLGPLRLPQLTHLVRMVTRAEMATDDQLVLEAVRPLKEIVEVHVAELVDFLAAMVWADEAQLGNEHLGVEHGWKVVEAGGAGVAGVGEQRRAN